MTISRCMDWGSSPGDFLLLPPGFPSTLSAYSRPKRLRRVHGYAGWSVVAISLNICRAVSYSINFWRPCRFQYALCDKPCDDVNLRWSQVDRPEKLVEVVGQKRLADKVTTILGRIEKELDEADTNIGNSMHVLDLDNDGLVSLRSMIAGSVLSPARMLH